MHKKTSDESLKDNRLEEIDSNRLYVNGLKEDDDLV